MEKVLEYLNKKNFKNGCEDSLSALTKLTGRPLEEERVIKSVATSLKDIADFDEEFKDILLEEFFFDEFPNYLLKVAKEWDVKANEEYEVTEEDKLAIGMAMMCSSLDINPKKLFR